MKILYKFTILILLAFATLTACPNPEEGSTNGVITIEINDIQPMETIGSGPAMEAGTSFFIFRVYDTGTYTVIDTQNISKELMNETVLYTSPVIENGTGIFIDIVADATPGVGDEDYELVSDLALSDELNFTMDGDKDIIIPFDDEHFQEAD